MCLCTLPNLAKICISKSLAKCLLTLSKISIKFLTIPCIHTFELIFGLIWIDFFNLLLQTISSYLTHSLSYICLHQFSNASHWFHFQIMNRTNQLLKKTESTWGVSKLMTIIHCYINEYGLSLHIWPTTPGPDTRIWVKVHCKIHHSDEFI